MSGEKRLLERLLAKLVWEMKSPIRFPGRGESISRPEGCEKGVYVIMTDKYSVLHVGQTPSGQKGVKGRLKDHLYGKSSFTRVFLNGNTDWLRENCSYAYIVVDEQYNRADRVRALLEALAIGKLCPEHIGHQIAAMKTGSKSKDFERRGKRPRVSRSARR